MRKGFRVPPQKSGQAKRSQAASPQSSLQQTAYAFRSQRKFPEAKPLLQQLYESDPSNIVYALDFGEACMETEDFSAAARIYAKIIEQDPKHVIALNNLGGALIRCGRIDDARSMLEYSLELDPQNLHARINLGGILQAAGDLKGNLDNALKAVAIDPTSALAFNNLGSAFSDMAMFNEAKHAFETALMLDSKQVDALINLGGIEARLRNPKGAIESYEEVVRLLPPSAQQRIDAVKFYASFEYLKLGMLEKGWDYYEGGFSPLVPAKGARSPNRKFSVPRWDGEPLNGKTLLVWREQGLGDELLFATCLHELQALGGQIIVECDARLVETFTRSFPFFRVRAEGFQQQTGNAPTTHDFDLHCPIGSLMRHFRGNIRNFERGGAYIKTDPQKVEKFKTRLLPHVGKHKLVGICWRSGRLDPVRNLGYTNLDEWSEVLKLPGFKFVNLQYGDCESELRAAEAKLGVEIIRWPDLDLKNDLDNVFALMNSLDFTVSVQTAVVTMSNAANVPTLIVKGGGWTQLGNKDYFMWFKRCKRTSLRNLVPATVEFSLEDESFLSWTRNIKNEKFQEISESLRALDSQGKLGTVGRLRLAIANSVINNDYSEVPRLIRDLYSSERNLKDGFSLSAKIFFKHIGRDADALPFMLKDLDEGRMSEGQSYELLLLLTRAGVSQRVDTVAQCVYEKFPLATGFMTRIGLELFDQLAPEMLEALLSIDIRLQRRANEKTENLLLSKLRANSATPF